MQDVGGRQSRVAKGFETFGFLGEDGAVGLLRERLRKDLARVRERDQARHRREALACRVHVNRVETGSREPVSQQVRRHTIDISASTPSRSPEYLGCGVLVFVEAGDWRVVSGVLTGRVAAVRGRSR